MILAIDPGSTKSHAVEYDGARFHNVYRDIPNADMLEHLRVNTYAVVVIEWPSDGGRNPTAPLALGPLLETAAWAGRFYEAASMKAERRTRREVLSALGLLGHKGNRDSAVRRLVCTAMGWNPKGNSNPAGLAGDSWQAAGLAIAYMGRRVRR